MTKRSVRDTPTFIEKAASVHGDRYGYTRAVYTASRNRLTITCTDHGDFDQVAADHLRGVGCPHCAGNRKSSVEVFRLAAAKIHGERYGYDDVRYVNSDTPIDYRYAKGKRTYSKRSFTKADIEARYGMSGKSEREMMLALGFERIYDCGKMRFEWRADGRPTSTP